jgi:hypothetical protein
MAQIETMRIKSTDLATQGAFVIIERDNFDVTVHEEYVEADESDLTVPQIKVKLDELGIAYAATLKRDDLVALLTEAQAALK